VGFANIEPGVFMRMRRIGLVCFMQCHALVFYRMALDYALRFLEG
jgi:hypothetical protein